MKPRVALLTHDLSGGLGTMTGFLHRVLLDSSRFQPEVILLATSNRDSASVLLHSPRTWTRGIQLRTQEWRGLSYTHVGAWGSEIELQRYMPRQQLTDLLDGFDLLQFVVGSPPWGCVASKVNRPKVLWTATTTAPDRASRALRDSVPRRLWASLTMPQTRRFERRAVREANSVLALSPYTLDAVRSLTRLRPISLAACGVDTNLFQPLKNSPRDYILCVARLSDARKNLTLLLHAYASLQDKLKLPDLCLVGELPSKDAQKLLRELGIEDKVRMLGVKGPQELAVLYQNAQFFVLSSDEEGLAIVLLEAMSSGLPVVCTACGGPETVVKNNETGFLTPVGDVEAFTHAMERLISDESLRDEMGHAARREAEEKYALDVTGQVFLDQYDQLLSTMCKPSIGNRSKR